MRILRLILAVSLLPLCALAQEMVKVNFLELYDKVPPPPASAKEAYQRCEHPEEEYWSAMSAGKFYQPMKDKVAGYEKQLEETAMKLAQPMTDQMKNVDQKEIQKKMKKMTQAEKIQFAMEMNKKMGMGPKAMTLEPPPVIAATEEYANVNLEVGKDIQKAGEIYGARAKLEADHKKKHDDVETWTEAEKKKLPRISGGEMDWIEPKALHALLLKAADKHLALENEYLANARKFYLEELAKGKKRFTALQQKMAAINYGEDAKNIETKRSLNGAQGLMLSPVAGLTSISLDATQHAAQSWARKVKVEKEKP